MNTRTASFAVVALGAALFASILQFAPVAQALSQSAALANNDIASVSASQKVRCIMPVAQQKYCGA